MGMGHALAGGLQSGCRGNSKSNWDMADTNNIDAVLCPLTSWISSASSVNVAV